MSKGSAKIGYAAMLEQFGPTEVVDYAVAAEQAGFSGVMAADHFQPWVPEQGSAPFVWNVMTLLAER
ncbi:MAG: LLM class flavin-dependent oxidoreductase, partial [Chloroflexi bacterium]|nr:LLM class flavin-dependent oxidoreductase [Chloroflexota bacterium]